MKMSEILQLVKPSDNHPCFHDMAEQFDDVFTYCKDYAKWDSRMSETYIIKWMCTDTLVGTSVIFMDGKPVAVAKQMARKSDKEFYWISAKTRNKVHMFMLTLVDTPVREFQLVDMEMDIPENYSLDYGDAILANEGIYRGEPVTIKHWNYIERQSDPTFINAGLTGVVVVLPDGELKRVDADEVYFPISLE